jgi:hypothetical protein
MGKVYGMGVGHGFTQTSSGNPDFTVLLLLLLLLL